MSGISLTYFAGIPLFKTLSIRLIMTSHGILLTVSCAVKPILLTKKSKRQSIKFHCPERYGIEFKIERGRMSVKPKATTVV